MLQEMVMASSAYEMKKTSDKHKAKLLTVGFSGQLKE